MARQALNECRAKIMIFFYSAKLWLSLSFLHVEVDPDHLLRQSLALSVGKEYVKDNS